MSMSPEQMRKKSLAEDESLKHARYAQADGSMRKPNTAPAPSAAIEAAGRRVNAATAKEDASIGAPDRSPNASIRFQELIMMSPDQKRQLEEARRESIEKTKDVCADGEKHKSEYDTAANQINNEQELDNERHESE